MKIFGASDQATGNAFLHAGYLSSGSGPGFYDSYYWEMGETDEEMLVEQPAINIHTSLELIDADKPLAAKIKISPARETTFTEMFSLPGDSPATATIVWTIVGFSLLCTVHLGRQGWRTRKKIAKITWLWPAVCALLITTSLGIMQFFGSQHSECTYRNPDAATRVIMQSLIATSLPGKAPMRILNVGSLYNEVGFPVRPEQHTPGMRYALRNFTRDGWGNPIILTRDKKHFTLISSGPDGIRATPDDIVCRSLRPDALPLGFDHQSYWEEAVPGMFVDTASKYCFIHRVKHPRFLFYMSDKSEKLTGSNLFDTFGEYLYREGIYNTSKSELEELAGGKQALLFVPSGSIVMEKGT